MSRWGKQGRKGVEEEKDVLEAAEQRHRDLMTNPDTVPEWAKPAANQEHIAPPVTEGEIAARLAALDVEQAEAVKNLNAIQERQRRALNDQLAQRKADEAKAEVEKTASLPEELASTMEIVRGFVGAEGPTLTPSPIIDHAQRGADALARAQRRSRGEVVEEPTYNDPAPLARGESPRQAQLRLRCAPVLAAAEARRQEIVLWERKIGPELDHVHVGRGEEESMVAMVNALMLGVPATPPNIAFVQSLIRSVQGLVETKSVMAGTLSRETTAIAGIIARCDSRGPMAWQGDRSSSWYQLERDVVGATTRLSTVTQEAVAGLWTAAKGIAERLKKLAEIRAAHAGTVVAPIVWESKAQISADADNAAELTKQGTDSGRRSRAITGLRGY